MAIVRHPGFRRLAVRAAWFAVALAFAHVALDSVRAGSVDIRGLLVMAAVVAVALVAATSLWSGPRLRLVSGAAGLLTMLAAIGLIFVRAAHETGLALIVGGAAIAFASIEPFEPEERRTAETDE